MPIVFPGAEFDPLEPTQPMPAMTAHDIVCVHTMATTIAGLNAAYHEKGYRRSAFPHFGVAGSGAVKQWQDLAFQSQANRQGNPRCISIETADRGETFPDWEGSDVPPWTDAQLDALVELISWACEEFDIPKELVPDSKPGRRGIAYHRLGIEHFSKKSDAPGGPWLVPGGERWSKATSKVCPGDRRIAQLKAIVIPRVQGKDPEIPEEFDMDEETLRKIIREEVSVVLDGQAKRVAGIGSWESYLEALLDAARAAGP